MFANQYICLIYDLMYVILAIGMSSIHALIQIFLNPTLVQLKERRDAP